jgi:hypothetical protein
MPFELDALLMKNNYGYVVMQIIQTSIFHSLISSFFVAVFESTKKKLLKHELSATIFFFFLSFDIIQFTLEIKDRQKCYKF